MADDTVPDQEKGLPPGVTAADLGDGQQRTAGAPDAPEVRNTPPEPTAEEKAKLAEAEAAEAAKAEEEKKKADTDDTDTTDEQKDTEDTEVLDEYISYGDETADSVVALLKESGVDPKEADSWLREAIESDDLSKIKLDEMIAKIGKEKANLVMLGVKDYYTRQTSATRESISAVHEVVGGEDNWKAVIAWAQKKQGVDKAFADQCLEYNKMFDLGVFSAKMAAKELRAAYEADSGNKSLTMKITTGDTAASGGLGSEPLSRADYVSQLKAAHEKNDFAEVDRLNQQRKATLIMNKR